MNANETTTGHATTELVFLLDRSGSMAGLETDTIGGFNAVLEQHRQQPGQAVLSTVLFDHETLVLHDRADLQQVRPLTSDDYSVRGSTALLDAVGGSIKHIAMVQRYLPDGFKPDKTIFVITTDGMENASRRYSYDDVKRLISEREEQGWEFLFLGANIDAAKEAGRIGIPAARAARYVADGEGSAVMFGAVAQATCNLREQQVLSEDWSDAIADDLEARG
ncbi:vWA domain-containing protein [Arabiibacter massiliensis]|uniref:vWA domain-containing protein n=1 Tax=Arabiibacter massiliensis TaxID=1870985 RepID=UPI0009B97480|nr:VWA domain-containing protein [Arabiibacter massiliensis]